MACIRMSLRSRVLDVDTVVNVVIPYDHFDREGRPKPFTRTLYLLHGLRQNADAWQRMSSAERFANYYGYALIMPDAQRSFYTDMAHGPRFFTYLTEELPEIIQAMFKIPADPAHTYVGGLSMGGYGALKIGLARPTQYAAIGCISAGVSNNTPDTVALRELRTGGRPLKDTEEDVPASIARAAALVKDAPRIYHTIGQEDSLLSSARETRDLLHSYPGDPFHYIYEEKPGKHGWEFCDGALRDFLQWLSPAPR